MSNPADLFVVGRLLALVMLAAAHAQGVEPMRGNPLSGIPLGELGATVTRPLFSPSRRPLTHPAVPPVIASPSPPTLPAEADHPLLVLLGTVVGERTKIAVFLDEASKDIVRLRVGQERAGWTLRSVDGRKVDFVRDSRIATLFLTRDADEQLPANLPVDVAASSNPDIASYRAAPHQRRGR